MTFNCVNKICIVWIRTVWLNWIAWNRNVFDKMCIYAKLNCLKFSIKMDLALNNLQRLIYHKNQPTLQQYAFKIERIPLKIQK